MQVSLLAFGVHPDDVELGCGGIILSELAAGNKVAIVDLTQGELGTRGTAKTRKEEAAAAGEILGITARENLKLADGFFENNKANQLKVISVIRKYKPEIIICNAPEDRHPDHGRSAELVLDAAFLSGLRKIKTTVGGTAQKEHRPTYVFQYIQDRYLAPDFVYDVSAVFEKKIEAVKAYKTQFHNPTLKEPQTYISTPDFLDSIVYRAKMMGKMIGVQYAEGLISKKMIGITGFNKLIKENT